MGNILEHYKREIEKSGLLDSDSDYGGFIGKSLIELCETICNQEHSGASFHRTVALFSRLMETSILTPLQGTDDEWVDVAPDCYQNHRRPSVFKNKATGEAYDIDGGPIFVDENGSYYTDKSSILHDIKFPYSPPIKREIIKKDSKE
jgi:hypothetical protein